VKSTLCKGVHNRVAYETVYTVATRVIYNCQLATVNK